MKDWFPKLVYGVALTLMIGWILVIGRSVILPVVAGIIVAYVILGLAELIGRIPVIGTRVPGGARYSLAMLIILGAMFAAVWLTITNITQISLILPRYQEQLVAMAQLAAEKFGREFQPDWQTLRQDIISRINIQRAIGITVASAASILATFIVVLIYAVFILAEKNSFARKIALMHSEEARTAQLQQVIRDINSSIGSYLVTKTLINIALGILSYGVMRFYGIPFAGFWAILIGVFNYIPYIGGFIGVGLPALLAIVELGAFWPFTGFLLAMIACQVLLGNFIEPFVMGRSLNLSPLVILVSLVAWAGMWGIAGAILSVPIMGILVIIFSEFAGTRPLAILMSKDGIIEKAGP